MLQSLLKNFFTNKSKQVKNEDTNRAFVIQF